VIDMIVDRRDMRVRLAQSLRMLMRQPALESAPTSDAAQ
jgi:acetyl-CoA carboxylase beta subunit